MYHKKNKVYHKKYECLSREKWMPITRKICTTRKINVYHKKNKCHHEKNETPSRENLMSITRKFLSRDDTFVPP